MWISESIRDALKAYPGLRVRRGGVHAAVNFGRQVSAVTHFSRSTALDFAPVRWLLWFPLCIACGLGHAFATPGTLYEVREIKPHVFVWVPDDILDQDSDPQFSRAGTAGFVIAPGAVVVVNATNSPFHARELLYEIRRRTDKPITYLIDTDSDGEHTLGNEVFVDERALIISSAAVKTVMRRYRDALAQRLGSDWRLQARMRGFHPRPPAETFEGERVLRLANEPGAADSGRAGGQPGQSQPAAEAGMEVKLIQFNATAAAASPGSSATGSAEVDANTSASSKPSGAVAPGSRSSGDVAVYLAASKVLFLGDLFQNAYYPRFGTRSQPRDVHRWIAILRQLETWDIEVYVPGHGAPGGKKELIEFRQFLEWLTNEVDVRIKENKPLAQVKDELKTPLENYRWHAPELAAAAVEAVYDELAKPQPAAPVAGD